MAEPHQFLSKVEDAGVLSLDDLSKERLRQFLRRYWSEVSEPDQDEDWVEERRTYLRDQWEDDFLALSKRAESPIEQIFGAYLLCINDGYKEIRFEPDSTAPPRLDFETVLCAQQELVSGYRSDFSFNIRCDGQVRHVVVECDGHDYHERTKQQAARDKKRDRAYLQAGLPVLRFTGSQIYQEPEKCAEEIEDLLGSLTERLLIDGGHANLQRRHKRSFW